MGGALIRGHRSQLFITCAISDNGGDSPLRKYSVSLSAEWAVHEAVLVGVTEVARTDEATSASNSSAVSVRFGAILREVPLDKAKLANVTSGSDVPGQVVAQGVASNNVPVAARGEGGVHDFDVVGMEGGVGFFAGVRATLAWAVKQVVGPLVD